MQKLINYSDRISTAPNTQLAKLIGIGPPSIHSMTELTECVQSAKLTTL